VLSRHTFTISRKKGSEFFDHRGTLRTAWGANMLASEALKPRLPHVAGVISVSVA